MSNTNIDANTVKYLANLVKISLNEEEVMKLQGQFTSILEYIDQLNQVNTDGIDPYEWQFTKNNPLRPDVVKQGLTREDALKNSKNKNDKFFKVPAVVSK